MMARATFRFGSVRPRILFGLLSCAALLTGRPAPAPTQENRPAGEALAAQLASQIAKSGKKRVVVIDFEGPERKSLPLGGWLADYFSAALGRMGEHLGVIDRARLRAALEEHHLSAKDAFESGTALMLGKSVGAEIVVKGSFGAFENGIGVTLAAVKVSGEWIGASNGKIPLAEEMEKQLDGPLRALEPPDGIFRAGAGGIGYPTCTYCPNPDYTREAREAKLQGTVVLQVVITPDGRTTDITVTKGPDMGLEEQSIKAVRRWRFKPALDANGKPVPVRVVVQATFRLY